MGADQYRFIRRCKPGLRHCVPIFDAPRIDELDAVVEPGILPLQGVDLVKREASIGPPRANEKRAGMDAKVLRPANHGVDTTSQRQIRRVPYEDLPRPLLRAVNMMTVLRKRHRCDLITVVCTYPLGHCPGRPDIQQVLHHDIATTCIDNLAFVVVQNPDVVVIPKSWSNHELLSIRTRRGCTGLHEACRFLLKADSSEAAWAGVLHLASELHGFLLLVVLQSFAVPALVQAIKLHNSALCRVKLGVPFHLERTIL
mmetsp:Transcript_21038/g.67041  ORF Transcript_21038/g.67041 Transcript_21038/m.67041 type:complete len:256 (-) Transcript_21038:856-1623(-)